MLHSFTIQSGSGGRERERERWQNPVSKRDFEMKPRNEEYSTVRASGGRWFDPQSYWGE